MGKFLIIKKIRKKLLFMKQCMSRTTSYLTVINSSMILFLFLSRLKEGGFINWEIDKYFLLIIAIGLISLITFGWIDIRFLRGLQEETKISFGLNPYFSDMRNKIHEINKKLDKIV